jgi:2-methylcitrate dehydratase PrpD
MNKGDDKVLTQTQELALWSVRQTAADLPRDVIELAKDCLLDHIAAAMHGMLQPWSRFVTEQVRDDAGVAESSIYGQGIRVPARAAALANGTAAHAFELDDWHGGSLAHLGACVIPAVMAVGERHHLSGSRALVAIVTGFEVMARCGMSVVPSVIIRGFHPTGSHGPMGSAAAIANLLRFTPSQATSAIAIATSCAGGLMEFSQDPQGMMVKRFHAGRGAEAGVVAASLALRGMTGPKSALEGKFGYCNVFSTAPRAELLTSRLGEDFQIRHNNVKLYACCGAMHAAIDIVQELLATHGFGPQDVAQVVFGGNQSHLVRHCDPAPCSVMAAQYSLPYAIAVALTGRALDPRMFDQGAWEDPSLLRLAKLVRVELHPDVEEAYPTTLGGHVCITLKDGRVLEKLRFAARGAGGDTIDRSAILEKATTLCAPFMDMDAMQQLFDCILSFERLDDVGQLARLMDSATQRKGSPAIA